MMAIYEDHHFQFFFAPPGLAETPPATCCAWGTTTLRSRMTLNAPCPLNASLSTESTTLRAGSTTSHWCGSKAQRATVWHSTLILVRCVCQSQVTSGRRGLLPVWSLAGASQVTWLLRPLQVEHCPQRDKMTWEPLFPSVFLSLGFHHKVTKIFYH